MCQTCLCRMPGPDRLSQVAAQLPQLVPRERCLRHQLHGFEERVDSMRELAERWHKRRACARPGIEGVEAPLQRRDGK